MTPKRFSKVWRCLLADGAISDWETGELSEDDVVDYAERVSGHFDVYEGDAGGEDRQRGWPVKQTVMIESTWREQEATDALRGYLAVHASRTPLVQRFRSEYLPQGSLFSRDEEIERFLVENLLFGEENLDGYLASHTGEHLGLHGGRRDDVIAFDTGTEQPLGYVEFSLSAEEAAEIASAFVDKETSREELLIERWESPPDHHANLVGEVLQGKYPWENLGDVVVFLLSGRPPRLAPPLGASLDSRNMTLSISFLPWISEETILRAYHAIKRAVHDSHPSSHQFLGEKTVRVLRFVSEQADEKGRTPSWSELLDRWNVANPDDKFKDRSALYKAHERAVKTLLALYGPLE